MERNVLLLYMSPFGRNPNIHTQTNEAAVQELRKHKEGPDYILALCSELVRTRPTVHLPDGKTCTTVEYFRDVFLPSVDIPAERLVVIPVPDSMEHLQPELDAIRRDAVIRVLPYGAITEGEKGEKLADLDAMAPYVVAFSDDGKGVQDRDMMRCAMLEAKRLGKLIVAHCEDNSLLRGGYIHDGAYAKAHGHRGICSESEWRPIQRDLELVRETGCGYHVCHISTKESVALIRRAKAEGLDVTCETGPHYLLLDDSCLQEDGRFKMNPPLRDKSDREALLEGLADGTIDMIATDHAPHSAEEKGRGLEKSAMGIVGLETAFPLLYTELVKPGVISMERLMELLHDAPCRRFNIPTDTGFTVFDLNDTYRIDPADFLSMGKATPFTGWEVQGRCLLTAAGETAVWYDADRLLKGE